MAVKERSKSKKTVGIPVPFFASNGEKKGTVDLPKDIFGQKPNKSLLAQAVRVYLSNQRLAHAKTKGRGEVSRTTKKVYRQKGTGGARHGARSAPLYVGGGIAHGPRGIENHSRLLPKAMRTKALISALSLKAVDGGIVIVSLDKVEPKTNNVAKFFKKMNMPKATVVLGEQKDLLRAARNIKDIVFVPVDVLNTYQVMAAKILVLTEDAVVSLEKRIRGSVQKEE